MMGVRGNMDGDDGNMHGGNMDGDEGTMDGE